MGSFETHKRATAVLVVILLLLYIKFLSEFISVGLFTIGLAIFIGYSFIPDSIDSPQSRPRGALVFVLLLMLLLLQVLDFKTFSIIKIYSILITLSLLILTQIRSHRHWFHSISASLFFSLIWLLVSPALVIFGLAGYLSHLFIDRHLKIV